MDVNLSLVSGRLAVPPDLELQPDGTRRARLLVLVRSKRRTRLDVLPVVVPPELHSDVLSSAPAGARVFVAGPLIRRCSVFPWEPSGLVEIIADAVRFPDLEDRSCS